MTKDEALTLARDWIAERPADRPVSAGKMISIIDRALAQPEEQQSCDKQGTSSKMQDIVCPNCGDMARTWPKQERPWVELTNKERDAIQAVTLDLHEIPKFFATAIEAKLKEKNT